eukprot:4961568-Pyramimonas_sp.AAC.1
MEEAVGAGQVGGVGDDEDDITRTKSFLRNRFCLRARNSYCYLYLFSPRQQLRRVGLPTHGQQVRRLVGREEGQYRLRGAELQHLERVNRQLSPSHRPG